MAFSPAAVAPSVSRKSAAWALLAVGLLTGACSQPATSPQPHAARLTLPPPGEPFPFERAAPPAEPTALDGTYTRLMTPRRAGGRSIGCVRCAPYRLEAGEATLKLDRGRFFVSFLPALGPRACPECKKAQGFRANGHVAVSGDEVRLFNDANCTRTTGRYRWAKKDGSLALLVLEDDCFGGLRARFFEALPWRG